MSVGYQQWWDQLTPVERAHARSCIQTDCLDEEMMALLSGRGPVGRFGIRWVNGRQSFLPGPFIDFVREQGSSDEESSET